MKPRAFPSRRLVLALTAIAVAPWALSLACVSYRPIVTRPPTLGSELISLDEARKAGLLTDSEFATRRDQTIAAWKHIGETPIKVNR